MKEFPKIFLTFKAQILHFLGIPAFAFCFVLLYRPFELNILLNTANDRYAFNLTMLICIIIVIMVASRMSLYGLRNKMRLGWGWYLFWCLLEIVVMSNFLTLYCWLIFHKQYLFLDVLLTTVGYTAAILFFPYIIFTLMLLTSAQVMNKAAANDAENNRVRFYDEKQNLKFVVAASAILYIEAEENYVRIHYTDAGKMKNYLLRNSMKNIEELCQYNGLVRCHRSFYINSAHVKVLRKDKEGIIFAELDTAEAKKIPVTKRYYEQLSTLL